MINSTFYKLIIYPIFILLVAVSFSGCATIPVEKTFRDKQSDILSSYRDSLLLINNLIGQSLSSDEINNLMHEDKIQQIMNESWQAQKELDDAENLLNQKFYKIWFSDKNDLIGRRTETQNHLNSALNLIDSIKTKICLNKFELLNLNSSGNNFLETSLDLFKDTLNNRYKKIIKISKEHIKEIDMDSLHQPSVFGLLNNLNKKIYQNLGKYDNSCGLSLETKLIIKRELSYNILQYDSLLKTCYYSNIIELKRKKINSLRDTSETINEILENLALQKDSLTIQINTLTKQLPLDSNMYRTQWKLIQNQLIPLKSEYTSVDEKHKEYKILFYKISTTLDTMVENLNEYQKPYNAQKEYSQKRN